VTDFVKFTGGRRYGEKITDNVDIAGLKNFNDFAGNAGLMQVGCKKHAFLNSKDDIC
jgi:hypothetical protein